MNVNELKEILKKHAMWLMNEEGGARANLRGADLRCVNLRCANLSGAELNGVYLNGVYLTGADLRGADLRGADLRGADLRCVNLIRADLRFADLGGANLVGANLRGADLGGANLVGANLVGADLRGADLGGANLGGANLVGADLRGAKLRGADLENTVGLPPLVCPKEGSYIGFKKAHGHIVVLQIPESAKRSSSTSRKCRASEAKVLRIENLDGSLANIDYITSDYDPSFVYTVGKTVDVKNFDDCRWNECAPGIHHFITRQEAVDY